MRRLVPVLLLMLAGCAPPGPADVRMEADAAQGELGARAGHPANPSTETGLRRIGTGARAAYLYVPKSYRADKPAPFIVMLHGAGGSGQHGIDLVTRHADRLGLIVLAPSSRAQSWDMISNRSYGADVGPLDAALADVFNQYAVDPERVAVGGFSDGASYALSLGLINGDLFRRIIAFSPGFMKPMRAEGRPAIFISHGVRDQVLPIDICSRRLVPALRKGGYEVDYVEFQGGHTVPGDLARRAYEALVGT
ncbi:MAG: phospholipase [Pseudomonadota bacterium]|nr:phospholipase [Pseudomonadota bacterium]